MLQPKRALAESLHQMLVMACDEDRNANGVEILEHPHDFLGKFGIKVAGGLIGEDQLGLVDDGTSDSYPLLLPTGKSHGQPLFLLEKTDLIQSRTDPPSHIVRVVSCDVQGKRDVFKDAAIVEESVILEDQAQFTA